QRAVRDAPGDPRAHCGYAAWLLDADRPRDAWIEANAAARLDPRSSDPALLCGRIARHLKAFGQAAACFAAVLGTSPEEIAAPDGLALALIAQPEKRSWPRGLWLGGGRAQRYPARVETPATRARVG